jgi:ribosomal-protein-serine acetyltransferase
MARDLYLPMLQIPPRSELRQRPLETPRLWLLPLELSDALDLWRSVESCRAYLEPWLPWVPFQTAPEASQHYAELSVNDWDQGRAVRFAVREKPSRRFLGVVSVENLHHLNLSGELGYWLRKDATGRGLMTEAAGSVVRWSFQALGAHRLRVAAATDNHASLGVIGRLGFRFEGIAREAELVAGRWLDHAIFARLSGD